jgi:hypothetical protein
MSDIRADVTVAMDFAGVVASILAGATKGQNIASERLLTLSAAEAPLDSNGGGTLVASGQAVHAEKPGDDALVTYDTPYATRWHEDKALVDSLGRKYSGESNFQNGRKSHYLSDPALQNVDELRGIITTEAQRGASS